MKPVNEPYSLVKPKRHDRNMARFESILTLLLVAVAVVTVFYLVNPFRISVDEKVAKWARANGL